MRVARFALIAGAVALAAAPAYAQKGGSGSAAPTASTMIGPFAGMNLSTISGPDFSGADNHTGFMAGGMLEHLGASGTFFRIGAKYSMRGAEASSGGITAKIKTSYLEIPAALGYRFPGTSIQPYLYAGAQVAVKLGCDLEASAGGLSASAACGSDSTMTMKAQSTDFGVLGGVGFAVPSGRGTLILDLRYLYGLQNVFSAFEGKNRGFTVGLGYLFPLGR